MHNSDLPYTIAYEDASLLLVDKPQGLATTPGHLPSLCEKLFAASPELAQVQGYKPGEGGLLNRLDNETGGLVLFAKSDSAFMFYAKLMREDKVTKKYLAITRGTLDPQDGVIDLDISHSKKNKRKMTVRKERMRGKSQAALTQYHTLGQKQGYSLLEVTITSGVRHQIRVHLAAKHAPVLGDNLYDPDFPYPAYPHHLLYAYSLQLLNTEGKLIQAETAVPFLYLWQNWQ